MNLHCKKRFVVSIVKSDYQFKNKKSKLIKDDWKRLNAIEIAMAGKIETKGTQDDR